MTYVITKTIRETTLYLQGMRRGYYTEREIYSASIDKALHFDTKEEATSYALNEDIQNYAVVPATL